MAVCEIELHPGHWKHTGSGANGILNEVTEARKVTKRVYEILKSSKVPVTYFEDNASSNQNQNLNTLVKHHNNDRDGLVVSIHFNSSGGTTNRAIGTEVYYYSEKALAAKISKAISDATGGGLLNRGAKQNKKLAVLARTYEPAILIEVCFVNSTVDTAIYRRDFEKICQAIAKELAAYIGKDIRPKKQSSTPKNNSKPSKGKSISQMADEVIAGMHGNGHETRRKSLGISKAEYEKVRAEVNRRSGVSKPSKPKKTISQMAEEIIKGMHGNGHEQRRKSLGISKAEYEKVRAEVNRRL